MVLVGAVREKEVSMWFAIWKRKSSLRIVLLSVILGVGIALVGQAQPAYAAKPMGELALQGGQISAQASDNVSFVGLYTYDATTQDFDIYGEPIYQDNTAKAQLGVSYDASTNTVTLSNCNRSDLNLYIEGTGTVNVQVVGTNSLLLIDTWGVGLNFTGTGVLTVNAGKTRPMSCLAANLHNNCKQDEPEEIQPLVCPQADTMGDVGAIHHDERLGLPHLQVGQINRGGDDYPFFSLHCTKSPACWPM